jgi:hypothetical protein
MNRTTRITALALAIAPALAFGQAATWNVDGAHTRAGFSVKHLVISDVKGEFDKLSGKVQLDDADLSKSSVEVTIEAASISTRDEKRDGHLKSADFFDVARYPTLVFKSTKVAAGKDGALLRFSLGNEYLKAGDAARAAEHLAQAVLFDPRYTAAWKASPAPRFSAHFPSSWARRLL